VKYIFYKFYLQTFFVAICFDNAFVDIIFILKLFLFYICKKTKKLIVRLKLTFGL